MMVTAALIDDLIAELCREHGTGLCMIIHMFEVSYHTFRQRFKRPLLVPGLPTCLINDKENFIAQKLLEFADQSTPSSYYGVHDVVSLFVSRFSPEGMEKFPFKNGVPGSPFVNNFIKRHLKILKQRKANLEHLGVDAASPRNPP